MSLPQTFDPKLPCYAIGDIHGRVDLLLHAYHVIKRDSVAIYNDPTPQVVTLGDYVDRGPSSKEVLDLLMDPPSPTFCLRGNHDATFIDYVLQPYPNHEWLLHYDAQSTIDSFNLKNIPPSQYYPILKPYIEFLNTTQFYLETPHFLLVHAGVNPYKQLKKQTESELMCIREPFLTIKPIYIPQCIVHGHTITPSKTVEKHPHRIALDVGGFSSNKLGIVRLDEDEATVIPCSVTPTRITRST